jgi:superfamily I DNA/RNA helicase
MGFASTYENILERHWGSEPLSDIWAAYLGPKTTGRYPPLPDPLDRPRRLIKDFWSYYQQPLDTEVAAGQWERHFQNLEGLEEMLLPVEPIDESSPGAWEVLTEVERRLREFFLTNPFYGPLSRQSVERIAAASKLIWSRLTAAVKELNTFVETARKPEAAGLDDLQTARKQFLEIRKQLEADLANCKRSNLQAKRVQELGGKFLRLYRSLAFRAHYRPALQHLHRLRLNDDQEGLVARNHDGAFRIQGTSGSGKTIILLHRALRLALEHPDKTVRVFTINRSLAELLRSSLAAIHGSVPPNLIVAAFYDFLGGCLALFEDCKQYRLVDDRSGERIVHSWHDFFSHHGKCPTRNVFVDPGVQELLRYVSEHGNLTVDACRYLRDEMIYVQTGYRRAERWNYSNPQSEPRRQRSVGLNRSQRANSLLVVEAWEEWLQTGNLCDVDGLSLRVADYCENAVAGRRIRETFPTHFILVDEVQDFSTLELRMLRQLVADPDGRNSIFLVGDLNQKVFAKHHRTGQAGYNFRGNAEVLKQNYRNTRQILRAAYCLPQMFPPSNEEDLEISDPELSPYEGGLPVAIACTPADHAQIILEHVCRRRDRRVAVVSENVKLLEEVRAGAVREGLHCHELFRVEDLDVWLQQQDVLEAELVVSRMEAVKGFEFDTVIVADLSEGSIPRPGTPEAEHWREAAITYTALTRARDELILTYVDQPSLFLKVMSGQLASPGEGSGKLRDALQNI